MHQFASRDLMVPTLLDDAEPWDLYRISCLEHCTNDSNGCCGPGTTAKPKASQGALADLKAQLRSLR